MGKNGRIFFDRPKPTVGRSASGRRSIKMHGMYVETAELCVPITMLSVPVLLRMI
jgi:hypothetical protein